MEDGLDHHHCDSHSWGGIIPKHSLDIITVLTHFVSQVIQFFLLAKGEPQSWNNQEKATGRGKDWFLVSSKDFQSCWKLRRIFFLPTNDIPQVAFTVGIALVGAVYVGIMMGINGNKSWRVGQLGFPAIVSLKTCSAAVLWFCTLQVHNVQHKNICKTILWGRGRAGLLHAMRTLKNGMCKKLVKGRD